MRLRGSIICLCLGLVASLQAQTAEETAAHHWADSLLQQLSLPRMAAQTLMMAAWSRDRAVRPELLQNVEKYGIGGIIFFQGHPLDQAYLTNFYQQQSAVPLFIGMDAEWGLSMRLSDLAKFPFAISMGAADDPLLARELGRSLGRECQLLGVHISFGPVVDVNTNPDNPIIGFRSFGENPNKVASMAVAQIQGMQEAGILACAKHFPGHGNTASDSHKELPLVSDSRSQLQSHLTPFQSCIDAQVASIMVAHLEVPALEPQRGLPSSLSKNIVQHLLREEMGFQGLIITDALNMKGVSGQFRSANACVMALEAGNDILLFPENAAEAIDSIVAAVRSGRIDSVDLRNRVFRILKQKYLAGLGQWKPVNTEHLMDSLLLVHDQFKQIWTAPHESYPGLSVLDPARVLPLKRFSDQHGVLVQLLPEGKLLGDVLDSLLLDGLLQNGHWDVVPMAVQCQAAELEQALLPFGPDAFVLLAHTETQTWGKASRELPTGIVQWLKQRNPQSTALLHAGNPYALRSVDPRTNVPILLSYESDSRSLDFTAQALYGEVCGGAQLPATLSTRFPAGYCLKHPTRSEPWKQGEMDSKEAQLQVPYLNMAQQLDKRMQQALNEGDFKSSQCVVMHRGKVVYQSSLGQIDADPELHIGPRPQSFAHVYDLASVTKVAATTLAVMKLVESRHLSVQQAIYQTWPEAGESPWGHLPLSAFLTHQTGLPAFLSFFKTMNAQAASHSEAPDSLHTLALSDACYVEARWADSAWQWIKNTLPATPTAYLYSDLNMIIMGKWVEHVSGVSLDRYLDSLFYQPMGLERMGYRPQDRGLDYWCVPSSTDERWPRKRICGIVHDPSAAVLGGVSGNAGLFSNAHDLAALFQMFCDGGTYKGKRYLQESTIKQFSKAYSNRSHRGLGFDRSNGKNNIFTGAPSTLFGHSGFTGTWAWTDPNRELVFVFLSNRTYPNENNKGLVEKGVRGELLESVYRYLPH